MYTQARTDFCLWAQRALRCRSFDEGHVASSARVYTAGVLVSAKLAVDSKVNPIIIDNTNTQQWEMAYYITLVESPRVRSRDRC